MFTDIENNYCLSGRDTMLGRHLVAELAKCGPQPEQTLFICHGTESDERASELNLEATRRLLGSLGEALPRRVVYVSSWQVYSPDAGEGVDESRPTFAWSAAGRSHAQTELLLEKWAAENGVTLTVVRPALMFGKGVDGDMLRLFNRVVRGHYVHIRGNDARMSAITAVDAARAIVKLAGTPGIFNLSDGRSHTWLSLAEAMTANVGAQKRMTTLPESWARWIYRFFRWLPVVEETLSESALAPVSRTLVLDNSRARQAPGLEFHDTLEVIARRDKDYPYEDA